MEEERPAKLYKCEFPGCHKAFEYKSWLKKHADGHSALKNLKCPYEDCWKFFKRADTLASHIRIHTGEKPFVCQEPGCDMKFANKAGLRYHKLKHKEKKSYSCSFLGCGRSFWTLAQLKQHEQTRKHCSQQKSTEEESVSSRQLMLDFDFDAPPMENMKSQPITSSGLEDFPISWTFSLSENADPLSKSTTL